MLVQKLRDSGPVEIQRLAVGVELNTINTIRQRQKEDRNPTHPRFRARVGVDDQSAKIFIDRLREFIAWKHSAKLTSLLF